MGGWQNGGWDVLSYTANPPSLKASKGEYNLFVDYPADPTGTNDSYSAINNALNAVPASVGGIVTGPPGNYLTQQPLKIYRLADTTPSIAPSIIGSGAGIDKFGGHQASFKFTAGGSFPSGEFLIDYLGTQTTGFSAMAAARIGELALECQNLAAGIRGANMVGRKVFRMVINEAKTPAPANATGTPTGGVSFVKQAANDYSYQNDLDQVYVVPGGLGQDNFCLTEGGGSSLVARNCASGGGGGAARYGINAGDATQLICCDSSQATTSDFYSAGCQIIGCTENFATKGNCIFLDNPFGNTARTHTVIGGWFNGTSQGALGEAAAAAINVVSGGGLIKATITAATCAAGTTTSRWLYVPAATTGQIIISAVDFNPFIQPVTGKFNLNGTAITTFRSCPGINPLAGVATPGFPATTVAVVNGVGVDVTAYITAGSTQPLTVQVDADAALMVIPATQTGSVFIPSTSSFTPTYAAGGTAPTWKWKGH